MCDEIRLPNVEEQAMTSLGNWRMGIETIGAVAGVKVYLPLVIQQ